MDTMAESDADKEVDIPVLPVKRKTKVSDTDLETVVRFVKKNRPNVISIGKKKIYYFYRLNYDMNRNKCKRSFPWVTKVKSAKQEIGWRHI